MHWNLFSNVANKKDAFGSPSVMKVEVLKASGERTL